MPTGIRMCDGPTVATLHGVRRHALYGARRLWCSSEQHCNVAVTVLCGYVVWDYSMGLHGAAWSCDGTASSLRAGRTCLMLMPGFHASSSFKMDKHTVPDGYTFGWNSGGTNLPSKVAKRDKQASKQASKQTNKQTKTPAHTEEYTLEPNANKQALRGPKGRRGPARVAAARWGIWAACWSTQVLTFGRLAGVLVREFHRNFEDPALPQCLPQP